jgi:beta-xylosidase
MEDYHTTKGTEITYDEKGNPWMDKETWEKTKGEYCKNAGISLHIDDSDMYQRFFKTSFALYRGKIEN